MMRVGGIGRTYDMDSHQVTDCMHEYTHMKQKTGAMASGQGMGMTEVRNRQPQQEMQMPLTNLLQTFLGKMKNFFRGLWNSNKAVNTIEDDSGTGRQAMSQTGGGSSDSGNQNIYKTTVPGANPYFQTLQEGAATSEASLLQRIRKRINGVTGRLSDQPFGGNFSYKNKNSFQAKSEQRPEEDLRKRSRYRKDELEIDCILTDESYLMDSYDRKGEYRRLTTKK